MKKSSRTLSWGGSLILVIGLHAGLFVWALYWQPQAKPVEVPPEAMLIELEPLTAPKPAPTPPPEARPEQPEPQPKLVAAPKPKLALAPPKPKPLEAKPQLKAQDKPSPPTAPAPVAKADDQPAAPQQAASNKPSQAKVSWQSTLLSHLSRYKRYPDDARRRGLEGVNRLRFVVDGNGKVLSYSLTSKSGSPSLDRATLQMIRRAQPLPPPPAEMLSNGKVELVAPFVYALERR